MSAVETEVVIIGAGLSGIGAACHLTRNDPNTRYLILESRKSIGGTWDLFRYPGVRSDSDMHTLGYSFRPWRSENTIADGSSILKYIHETAVEYGVDQHIWYGQRVSKAEWSSTKQCWTLTLHNTSGDATFLTCLFINSCTGYYSYDDPHTPSFVGLENFKGHFVHPQSWPSDLNYEGKRVVVIGSGATAVTIVPAMAVAARHVTMLQRSPTYIVSSPAVDPTAKLLRRFLSSGVAGIITRWRYVLMQMTVYQLSRRFPKYVKNKLIDWVRLQVGDYCDVKKHFNPRYKPWDQRLCIASDGDLFNGIRNGDISVITQQISNLTEDGVRLASGDELKADIIVSATGLKMLPLGGMSFFVDDVKIDLSQCVVFRGAMLSGLPNMIVSVGYTNASWTLKVDLINRYFCRLKKFMDRKDFRSFCVVRRPPGSETEPLLDFSSSYVMRSIDKFPRQGQNFPWRLYQNYILDIVTLRLSRFRHSALRFYK
jgi:monooxygenase